MKIPLTFILLLLISSCTKKEESNETIKFTRTGPEYSLFLRSASISGFSESHVLDTNTALILLSTGNNGDEVKLLKKAGNNIQTIYTSADEERAANLKMISSSVGFFTGGYNYEKLYKTTDGGLNWTKTFTAPAPILDLKVIDENNLYLISASAVYKSSNGGLSWNVSIPYSMNFSPDKLFFINKNTGFVLYEPRDSYYAGGTYKKTTDGGATWTDYKISTTYNENFSDIYFTDENNGYALPRTHNALYITKDGGAKWVKSTLDIHNNNGMVFFFPDGRGLILTSGRFAYYTEDFGKTTKLLFEAGYGQFTKIQVLDDTTLIAHHNKGVFKIIFNKKN